jgi:hypothetical protein
MNLAVLGSHHTHQRSQLQPGLDIIPQPLYNTSTAPQHSSLTSLPDQRSGASSTRAEICIRKELAMSEHIYKLIELVGSSKVGIEDAVQNAITKCELQELAIL